jgi:hypothetical protein
VEPYRFRSKVRRNLPWWLIDLGIASKGKDCEQAGGQHQWYNRDNVTSGCYHCVAVRPGRLWEPADTSSFETKAENRE